MNEKLKLLTENSKELLGFMRPKYRLFHLSNVFFRDIHFGIMSYLELKGVKYSYVEAEELTKRLIESLEKSGIFKKIDSGAWMLNYPEFKKPPVKRAAPAKPAAGAAAPRLALPAGAKPGTLSTAPKTAAPVTSAVPQASTPTFPAESREASTGSGGVPKA